MTILPGRNNISPVVYLLVILVLAAVLLLWGRGSFDIYEWDEARNGVNAYSMFFSGDYINLYYGSDPDTITSKPPLLIWLMVLSHHLFGFNEFALRFPTLIATLFFFIAVFRLVQLYEGAYKAFLTCMVLITCRAIIAGHVGLTGDFDALLILFLTFSTYYLAKFLEQDKVYGLYLAAVFTGMAFYTKGTAAFLFLPGIFIYLIISGKFKKLFGNVHTYGALTVLVLIVGSWVYIATTHTAYPDADKTMYGSNNSIETMLIHETYNRIVDDNFSDYETADPLFFVHTIEWRMNMWHILFYLSIVIGAYQLYVRRSNLLSTIRSQENRLTILGICLSLPIILLVNFSVNTLNWYFAPTWMFIAFFVVRCMVFITKRWQPAGYIFFLVFAFNLVKHFMFVDSRPSVLHKGLTDNEFFKGDDPVVLFSRPKDDILLYTLWMGKGFVRYDTQEDKSAFTGKRGIIHQNKLNEMDNIVEVKDCYGSYCLVTVVP